MSLKNVHKALLEIAAVSGRKDKESLLDKYSKNIDYFHSVLWYAYHPYMQYNTTIVPAHDIPKRPTSTVVQIFDCLERLSTKNGVKQHELEQLGQLAAIDKETHTDRDWEYHGQELLW